MSGVNRSIKVCQVHLLFNGGAAVWYNERLLPKQFDILSA